MLLASNQKLDDTTIATDVAYSLAEELATEYRHLPSAFGHDNAGSPFDTGAKIVGSTDYLWEVYLTDVTDTASGEAVGSGPTGAHSTKLKKMLIVINWWGGERQGMGTLELRVTRLFKASNAP